MKKIIIGLLIMAGSMAYAVSIDFNTYAAVQIGDLQTATSDDGVTVTHSIEFSGPGLKALVKLLPSVKDENDKTIKGLGMLNVTNAGQEGVDFDKSTSIYIQCNDDEEKGAACSITIIKGVIPG